MPNASAAHAAPGNASAPPIATLNPFTKSRRVIARPMPNSESLLFSLKAWPHRGDLRYRSKKGISLTHTVAWPCQLKTEKDLKVKPAIGCGGREGTTGKTVRKTEDRRRNNAYGRSHVNVVEQILRGDAERKPISAIRWIAGAEASATAAPATTARAASKRAAAGAAQSGVGRAFFLCAEAEGFAEPQVEAKAARAGAKVVGDNNVSCDRGGIQTTEPRGNQVGGRTGAAPGCKRWAIIKNRIVVVILARGDVVRSTGLCDDERAEAERIGEADGASDKETIANIVRSPAIVVRNIV